MGMQTRSTFHPHAESRVEKYPSLNPTSFLQSLSRIKGRLARYIKFSREACAAIVLLAWLRKLVTIILVHPL